MNILKLFIVYYLIVACSGRYARYVEDHALEKYCRKQRELIKQKGKLIAYFYRNYNICHKRKYVKEKRKGDKWVYTRCFDYAKKFKQEDINYAITCIKSDVKVFDIISFIITICAGLSSPIINSFVIFFCNKIDPSSSNILLKNCIENLVGLFYIGVLIAYIILCYNVIRKQAFLLNILEDTKRYINDKVKKEQSS